MTSNCSVLWVTGRLVIRCITKRSKHLVFVAIKATRKKKYSVLLFFFFIQTAGLSLNTLPGMFSLDCGSYCLGGLLSLQSVSVDITLVRVPRGHLPATGRRGKLQCVQAKTLVAQKNLVAWSLAAEASCKNVECHVSDREMVHGVEKFQLDIVGLTSAHSKGSDTCSLFGFLCSSQIVHNQRYVQA